ncbi:hypothetical protein GF359_08690 [candidate division WOR-3 bacterium]|uniref:PKD/Chitinase domain-containing protein n=1 Tax=candidate division WOR-3 bacterium TaxID=2052148 RepID=A0A9D5QDN9_UNCW3|nr:hypothetical protein [candidate division WOR-3 bacterium]MBD3365277.1 hypothetical protein [candidate division WOR-3 bacterium]
MRRKYIFVLFTAVAVMMLAGCNNPPIKPRIVASETSVESGDVVILSAAEIGDPDNDTSDLKLRWSADGGEFNTETSLNVNWTAPDVEADEIFRITLTVEDPEGATNSQYVDITVAPDTTPDDEGHEIILGSAESSLDFPFNAGNYGRSQFLYFADEIDYSGKIIKMGLSPAEDTTITYKNLKIWFVPVDIDSIVDTLEHNIDDAPKTLVFQSDSITYGPMDEWFDFKFVNAFNYDGIKNLLIRIQYDMLGDDVEGAKTYAYDKASSTNRHVGIVRSEDEKGTAESGTLYLKLVFELLPE